VRESGADRRPAKPFGPGLQLLRFVKICGPTYVKICVIYVTKKSEFKIKDLTLIKKQPRPPISVPTMVEPFL